MATTAQRRHLHELMQLLLEHEHVVHYAQVRPMRTAHLSEVELEQRLVSGRGVTMDCSEAVTLVCRLAGLHDPNRLGYDGYGNSHTMWAHLPHYADPSHALVGAIVAYGHYGNDHVAMVLERGADPWLWSHGSEAGPRRVRWSVENQVHGGSGVLLSVAHL